MGKDNQESREIAVITPQTALAKVGEPLSVDEIIAHVRRIEEVMQNVMKKDVHYGTIPGTNKPTLLQPGAQKLALTFRFRPELDEREVLLANGHREYHYICKLYNSNGEYLGAGVGCCSTMESKYRWRSGEARNTGEPVPAKYWDLRKKNPTAARDMIGGKGFRVLKDPDDGKWYIAEQGERIENPDIADTYNTVKKMGKKRAYVDAVITVTGSSDMWTQDIEDHAEPQDIPGEKKPQSKPRDTGTTDEDKRELIQRARIEGIERIQEYDQGQAFGRNIEAWHDGGQINDAEYEELKAAWLAKMEVYDI